MSTSVPSSDIQRGRAGAAPDAERGWFVGPFLREPGLRQTAKVEVKWGVHATGEERQGWGSSNLVTLSLLVSGRFRLRFEHEEHLLTEPGDYVVWAPGVIHTWIVEADAVVLTVRWPAS